MGPVQPGQHTRNSGALGAGIILHAGARLPCCSRLAARGTLPAAQHGAWPTSWERASAAVALHTPDIASLNNSGPRSKLYPVVRAAAPNPCSPTEIVAFSDRIKEFEEINTTVRARKVSSLTLCDTVSVQGGVCILAWLRTCMSARMRMQRTCASRGVSEQSSAKERLCALTGL
jgi:hypothetical protein